MHDRVNKKKWKNDIVEIIKYVLRSTLGRKLISVLGRLSNFFT